MKTNENIPATSRSVHLSASAGSGKTKALTDRYLALLELLDQSGLGIDQAVAITFTDKAAAEIKQRVMRDLPEPMLKKIIRGRQDLRISTIHSFCMNILKRYPLEAGLPPDFGILDERDRITKIRTAVEEALESSGRDAALMRPLREHSVDKLTALIESVFSLRSRLKRIEIDAGGQEELDRAFRSGMGVERAAAELQELLSGRAWRSQISAMEALLRPLGDEYDKSRGREHLLLAEARDSDTALPLVSSLEPVYFTAEGSPRKNPFIAKKSYRGTNRPEYENTYFAVREQLVRVRELSSRVRSGQEALSLFALSLRAGQLYDAAKLREGLLDFDDLEIAAYRLLQGTEWPDILYWLDRKVLHFLVDEFQDTSDIQWALLNTLTGELFAGEGADKPMPPTLFVVGDEKQSIYRFREANYRLIENVRRKMLDTLPPDARDIRTLGRNFRSTPAVVDAVNRVFGALWGEHYAPSEADRACHEGSVRLLEVMPRTEDEEAGPAEAAVLAREIRSLVERGTIVHERGKGARDGEPAWTARPAGYSDCAVLIQTRARLKEYENALQQEGVPFRVVGGIGFYDEDEVQAVISVLFFLWNRDDRFSLAGALRSGLFGLSDQDILEVFSSEDPFAALQDIRPGAADLLRSWTALSGIAPLADLVRRIIIDAGAYIRFGRKNHQAVFNLDKLIDTARDFDGRGFTTLQDFVEWVRNIRESDLREAAADMNLPGVKGAVSIMTVHKAKGLEFPVLFLPGVNQRTRSVTDGPRVLIESDGPLRMAFRSGGNAAYREMWKREQEELLREHQRLLYVAMTRARDHLVMLGTLQTGGNPVRENTWLSYLERSLPAREAADGSSAAAVRCRSYPSWEAKEHAPNLSCGPASAADPLRRVHTIDPAVVLRNLGPVATPAPVEWKKATDLVNGERGFSPAVPFAPEPGAVPPMVRGSVLHRCLEDLSRTGSFDLDARALEFDEVRSLDRDSHERFLSGLRSVLASVTGNKELSWIFEHRTGSYSELPFLSRKGNSLISGVIDRLVVKEGKGYVIDYKAIRTENDEAARTWTGHYQPQVRVYCEAVKEIFRLDAVEGYLLFLDSGRLEQAVKV